MKFRFFLFGIVVVFSCQNLSATNLQDSREKQDSVKASINYLNQLLGRQGNWYPQSSGLETKIRGLIHYVESDRVDSLMKQLDDYSSSGDRYFFRTPENVSDSLQVPGYMSYKELKEKLARIDRSVRDNINKDQIAVPEQLLTNLDEKVKTLKPEESERLLGTGYVSMRNNFV